ncbi:lipid A phosphoethanolamine transferase, partial [Acinetobacter ursingii]|nr:lipid A phosphoethanolamine transferase [Acinetobacter ursingii]
MRMATLFKLKRISISLRMFNILVASWLASFTNIGFYEHLCSFSSFSGFISVHDKFHRTLILSGFCLLKIAKISLNSSF